MDLKVPIHARHVSIGICVVFKSNERKRVCRMFCNDFWNRVSRKKGSESVLHDIDIDDDDDEPPRLPPKLKMGGSARKARARKVALWRSMKVLSAEWLLSNWMSPSMGRLTRSFSRLGMSSMRGRKLPKGLGPRISISSVLRVLRT